MSVERYFNVIIDFKIFKKEIRLSVLYRSNFENIFELKVTTITVICCALLSLIWTILPLIGWSYYSVESTGISCSVEWQDRSLNVITYNITIFSFVFIIPLIILLVTNIKIIIMVILIIQFSFYEFYENYLISRYKKCLKSSKMTRLRKKT